MQRMKFSKLSLLSQRERRGLQINFSADSTVLVAGNGYGKSAILKSLYETLGARPHKVDKSWKSAQVLNLLEFSIGLTKYVALKLGDTYTIYDSNSAVLINTSHVMAELAPFMAALLDFRLVLADKQEQIKTPPPSYAFAPFYVDQDRSWQKAWDSFSDLSIFSRSPQSLSEYHSGLRPNEYYEAKAERDRAKGELATINAERLAVHQALVKIREEMPATALALNLEAFTEDTNRLVTEGQALHNEQARYRSELGSLNEDHHLWQDHVAVVESALREIDASFNDAVGHPADVECPMCGQHYTNHIADQFSLKADKDDLVIALQSGRSHLKEISDKLQTHKRKMDGVTSALAKVQQILAIRREDISILDIVQAEGRAEAQRFLQQRLSALDSQCGDKQRLIDTCEQRMKATDSRERKAGIQAHFQRLLTKCALDLDVTLGDSNKGALQGLHIGRGSVGPRALAAYYYAFLHTARDYGSSTFCPIVIDAPNQQGQDQGHLQRIMTFLLTETPKDSQVIIGAETAGEGTTTNVKDISFKKDQVLRDDQYEFTLEYVRPFLHQSIIV